MAIYPLGVRINGPPKKIKAEAGAVKSGLWRGMARMPPLEKSINNHADLG